MKTLLRLLTGQGALALTLGRMVLGVMLGYGGYLKLNGDMAVRQFTRLGLPLAEILGPVIAVMELAGGLALFMGVATRLLGVWFSAQFIVAALVVTRAEGLLGARLEFALLALAVLLATHGAGALGLGRPEQPWEI